MDSQLLKLAITFSLRSAATVILVASAACLPELAYGQTSATCDIGSLPPQPANYKVRGSRLLRLSKNDEALSCFKKALEDSRGGKDPEVWNGLGVALARLRMFEEAIAAYDQALAIPNGVVVDRVNREGKSNRLKPQDYYIFWFNKGTALGDLGKNEEALDILNKSISLRPNYGPAWFYRGVYLHRLERNDEAAIAYTKATAFAPELSYALLYKELIASDDFLFWQGQGVGYARIGRYKEAKAALQRAEEVRGSQLIPEHYGFYYEGVKLLAEGSNNKALKAFEQSTQVKPDFAEGWHAKGNVLAGLGQYKDAIAAYDQAVKFDPYLHNAWFERGLSYSRLKQPQAALSSYRKATEIANNFAEAWHNSGRILYDANRYPDALTAFNNAIDGGSLRGGVEPYESLFGKSVTLYALKRYPEAMSAVNQTLKLNPQFKGAIALRDRLRKRT